MTLVVWLPGVTPPLFRRVSALRDRIREKKSSSSSSSPSSSCVFLLCSVAFVSGVVCRRGVSLVGIDVPEFVADSVGL